MLPTRTAKARLRLVDELQEDRILARHIRPGHLVRDYHDRELVAVAAVDDPDPNDMLTITALPVAGELRRIRIAGDWPLQAPHLTANPTPATAPATATATLAVDVALFAFDEQHRRWQVLLVERGWDPDQGKLALPGGYVDVGETSRDAASRELAEETGVRIPAGELTQVGAYDAPGRDPRGRVVSIVYRHAVYEGDPVPTPVAGTDARTATWHVVDDVLARPERLAFDHDRILTDAYYQAID